MAAASVEKARGVINSLIQSEPNQEKLWEWLKQRDAELNAREAALLAGGGQPDTNGVVPAPPTASALISGTQAEARRTTPPEPSFQPAVLALLKTVTGALCGHKSQSEAAAVFRDFDTVNAGRLVLNDFSDAVMLLGVDLSLSESKLLAAAFAYDPSTESPMVKYLDFLDAVYARDEGVQRAASTSTAPLVLATTPVTAAHAKDADATTSISTPASEVVQFNSVSPLVDAAAAADRISAVPTKGAHSGIISGASGSAAALSGNGDSAPAQSNAHSGISTSRKPPVRGVLLPASKTAAALRVSSDRAKVSELFQQARNASLPKTSPASVNSAKSAVSNTAHVAAAVVSSVQATAASTRAESPTRAAGSSTTVAAISEDDDLHGVVQALKSAHGSVKKSNPVTPQRESETTPNAGTAAVSGPAAATADPSLIAAVSPVSAASNQTFRDVQLSLRPGNVSGTQQQPAAMQAVPVFLGSLSSSLVPATIMISRELALAAAIISDGPSQPLQKTVAAFSPTLVDGVRRLLDDRDAVRNELRALDGADGSDAGGFFDEVEDLRARHDQLKGMYETLQARAGAATVPLATAAGAPPAPPLWEPPRSHVVIPPAAWRQVALPAAPRGLTFLPHSGHPALVALNEAWTAIAYSPSREHCLRVAVVTQAPAKSSGAQPTFPHEASPAFDLVALLAGATVGDKPAVANAAAFGDGVGILPAAAASLLAPRDARRAAVPFHGPGRWASLASAPPVSAPPASTPLPRAKVGAATVITGVGLDFPAPVHQGSKSWSGVGRPNAARTPRPATPASSLQMVGKALAPAPASVSAGRAAKAATRFSPAAASQVALGSAAPLEYTVSLQNGANYQLVHSAVATAVSLAPATPEPPAAHAPVLARRGHTLHSASGLTSSSVAATSSAIAPTAPTTAASTALATATEAPPAKALPQVAIPSGPQAGSPKRTSSSATLSQLFPRAGAPEFQLRDLVRRAVNARLRAAGLLDDEKGHPRADGGATVAAHGGGGTDGGAAMERVAVEALQLAFERFECADEADVIRACPPGLRLGAAEARALLLQTVSARDFERGLGSLGVRLPAARLAAAVAALGLERSGRVTYRGFVRFCAMPATPADVLAAAVQAVRATAALSASQQQQQQPADATLRERRHPHVAAAAAAAGDARRLLGSSGPDPWELAADDPHASRARPAFAAAWPVHAATEPASSPFWTAVNGLEAALVREVTRRATVQSTAPQPRALLAAAGSGGGAAAAAVPNVPGAFALRRAYVFLDSASRVQQQRHLLPGGGNSGGGGSGITLEGLHAVLADLRLVDPPARPHSLVDPGAATGIAEADELASPASLAAPAASPAASPARSSRRSLLSPGFRPLVVAADTAIVPPPTTEAAAEAPAADAASSSRHEDPSASSARSPAAPAAHRGPLPLEHTLALAARQLVIALFRRMHGEGDAGVPGVAAAAGAGEPAAPRPDAAAAAAADAADPLLCLPLSYSAFARWAAPLDSRLRGVCDRIQAAVRRHATLGGGGKDFARAIRKLSNGARGGTVLGVAELRALLGGLARTLSGADLAALLDFYDADGSGEIDLAEFFAATLADRPHELASLVAEVAAQADAADDPYVGGPTSAAPAVGPARRRAPKITFTVG